MMPPLYLFVFFFLSLFQNSFSCFCLTQREREWDQKNHIGSFVLLVSLFMDCLYIIVNTRNFLEFYFEKWLLHTNQFLLLKWLFFFLIFCLVICYCEGSNPRVSGHIRYRVPLRRLGPVVAEMTIFLFIVVH